MPVLNTASPKVSPVAPYASPRNARPSSSTSSAAPRLIARHPPSTSDGLRPLSDRFRAEKWSSAVRSGGGAGPGGAGGSCGFPVEHGRTAAQERGDDA